ncbi:MAG: 7-cyano-7-deazaguanine synthase QueC [Planctomycetaceae bacterium]|nr:7-cyano-7-deazaguanine synthase QueC [Planctomycetaceae bacterium]
MENFMKAIVLLSGGLDSSTTAAIAKSEGFDELYALTVNYGQRHLFELEAARRVGEAVGVKRHEFLNLDLACFGGSALTDPSIAVPHDREMGATQNEIPDTYVPARNTVMLSLALAFAETVGAEDIFLGINHIDYSGYPDCRPEFLEAFETMANLATKASVEGRLKMKFHAPLLYLSKAQIVQRGMELGVDYSLTHTCYDPAEDGTSCGRCDACRLRLEGFRQAGFTDPVPYQNTQGK